MRLAMRGHLEDAATPSLAVRLGVGIVVASAAIVVSTIWLMSNGGDVRRVALIEVGTAALALLFGFVRPRAERSLWLLSFPALIVASLLADSAASSRTGITYGSLFTLVFIYTGLSLRRGTSSLIAPVVGAAWYFCQTTSTPITIIRLPIAVAIWVVIGELLASRTVSLESQIGQLTDAAHTDALTGLANRRGLDAALAALECGDAVVLLDLDHFKQINDERGHAAGDAVIREFAVALRQSLRATDIACRYGGEELVAIVKGGNVSTAAAVLWRLRARWRSAEHPTFSAGVCVHKTGTSAQTLTQA
ncbi:MAG: GGDEF domain-containing protein, partial [Acidimicrobiales bacterium]